jgi:hypothetical protein
MRGYAHIYFFLIVRGGIKKKRSKTLGLATLGDGTSIISMLSFFFTQNIEVGTA